MTASIIDLDIELHHRVGLARPILADVRWTVQRGQHWALVGANGAGKSTLLSLIAGDPWPSRGTIRVLGREYGKVDKRTLRRRIGVVSAALYERFPPGDTALDVVASGVWARIGRWGEPPAEEVARARSMLARLRADDTSGKTYGVLSQGERQRVMIARALVGRPALLILDEPCAGLDPGARERFVTDLSRLTGDDDPTQIIVTHHLEEIPAHVTHALLLHRGTTLACGPVDEVLTGPRLSEAFGARCTVERKGAGANRRYALDVTPEP